MTTARAFRDTVPMGLMQNLPPMQAVPVLDQVHSMEEGAELLMGAKRTNADLLMPQGALLLPGLARALMAVSATAAAAVTVLLLLLGAAGNHATAGLLSVPWALLVVAAAGSMRVRQALQWRAMTASMVFMALLVAATAWALGLGLASPTLSVLGLLVCAVCAMAGWHAGMGVAAASLLGIGAVALNSWPDTTGSGLNLPVMQLGTHLIVLAVGMACGTLLARTLAATVMGSRDREERFSRLLALAADAYWEVDQDYRLVSVTAQNTGRSRMSMRDGLGSVPWELPNFGCDPATLDDLMADLDGRNTFHERLVSWTTSRGDTHQLLVSGEPRFDHRGVFTGFWGVSRDVTEMVNVRVSLQSTESRYQELFARIPTPLLMHRDLHIVDANPAALQLLGYPGLQDIVGVDLLSFFESADARDRALQRVEQLERQPVGAALPITHFKLRAHGRVLAIRVSSVRVQVQDGPAVLSIFIDDTERLASEDSVRRSEAMLSHLVATSPELVMVQEADSGRFVMVNQAFEKVTGRSQKATLGRTAQELQLWADEDSRLQLLQQLVLSSRVTEYPATLLGEDGQPLVMRLSAARFEMDRRDYLVLNARDITDSERARMERETILTHASIGIAVTRHGRLELANPHFENIFGAAPGSLVGQLLESLWPGTVAWASLWQRYGQQIENGQPVTFEATARRLDGNTFVAHVRARSIDPARPQAGGTAWIVEDVTQRRDFEQALARARDDAEAASRAKSAFLANTSHELRTPLNGLIGLTRLAREPQTTETQRRVYLEQIGDSAHLLAGIITDILDVSKIEAGKLLLEATVFDLGKLLLALQTTFTPLAQAKRLTLHFEIDPEVMGGVQGDPLRVRQILSNYVTNAIKFTPSGQVRLKVYRVPVLLPAGGSAASDRVRFEVHDTGPGLSPALQAQLFKPFSQADQSATRRFGGTGLGLSLNRELATLMGGDVGVVSDVGQGCTFWVELPLPVKPSVLAPSARAGAGGLQDMRVLMVEDNPVNMLIAVAMLERWGVKVTQALNGREAVLAVQRATETGHAFDAVLMDVQMPVMSGHEATRELRRMPAGRDLPIIALTAAALVSEREEALRAGMNDFLTKPIDSEKLRSTLQRCCATIH